MPDLIQDTRKKIDARIKELRPLVDELRELERVQAALGGGEKKSRRVATKTKPKSKAGSKPGRSPKRATQALKVIEQNPGITVSEVAKRLKINPNYLYRVFRGLAEEGKVAKDGSGYSVPKAVEVKDEAKTEAKTETPDQEAIAV